MSEQRGDIMTGDGAPRGHPAKPAWLKERLAWFQSLRFGLFLHGGPSCQWDCCESWPLVEEDGWARPDDMRCWVERGRDLERFTKDYRELNRTFDPVHFDARHWAKTARRTGMRYVTFTAKHHDGFCLWDTKTTDYRVTGPDCPFHDDPRSDIVREVFDAFRAEGLAISCYFSKSDWTCPWYWDPARPARTRNPNYDPREEPERWARFVEYTHRQVEELMTGYGPIDVLWLDGGQVRPPEQDLRMDELVATARRHQPGLIVADRTVGGDYEDFVTPERTVPDDPPDVPWESCLTMGDSWKYVEHDRYKPADELVRLLVEVTAKGGNLLLGFGPKPDGTWPAEAVERLEAIGAWMDLNADQVFS